MESLPPVRDRKAIRRGKKKSTTLISTKQFFFL